MITPARTETYFGVTVSLLQVSTSSHTARDVWHVHLSRTLSAADVADALGLSGFNEYELRHVVPDAEGSGRRAELHAIAGEW